MVGKYVYLIVGRSCAKAVSVSMKVVLHFARRCSSSREDWAASGFPGAGARTPKPCSSKSFRRAVKSKITLAHRRPLPRASDAATAPRLKPVAARKVTFMAATNAAALLVVGLAPGNPV